MLELKLAIKNNLGKDHIDKLEKEVKAEKEHIEKEYGKDHITESYKHYITQAEKEYGRFAKFEFDKKLLNNAKSFVNQSYYENSLAKELLGDGFTEEVKKTAYYATNRKALEKEYKGFSKEGKAKLQSYIKFEEAKKELEVLNKKLGEKEKNFGFGNFCKNRIKELSEQIDNNKDYIAGLKEDNEFKKEFASYFKAKKVLIKMTEMPKEFFSNEMDFGDKARLKARQKENFAYLGKLGVLPPGNQANIENFYRNKANNQYVTLEELARKISFTENSKNQAPNLEAIDYIIKEPLSKTRLVNRINYIDSQIEVDKGYLAFEFNEANNEKFAETKKYAENANKYKELLHEGIQKNDFTKLKEFLTKDMVGASGMLEKIGLNDKKSLERKVKLNKIEENISNLGKLHTDKYKHQLDLEHADKKFIPVESRDIELEISAAIEGSSYTSEVKRCMKEKLYADSFANDKKTITVEELETTTKFMQKAIAKVADKMTGLEHSIDDESMIISLKNNNMLG